MQAGLRRRAGSRWAIGLVLTLALIEAAAAEPRRSSFDDMSPATQAMQRDDRANPAWLWLLEGRRRFAADCAGCHEGNGLDGVAARYPAWDERFARVLTLGARIAQCQLRYVGTVPQAQPGEVRLGLEMALAQRARGLPIAPPDDPRLSPWRERGRALFTQRMGQLDLSCAHCHERAADRRLGGNRIGQGHPTGYPIYRLEWQGVGTVQRRLRGCMLGMRAEPFAEGSDEATSLELYLMSRAAGLPIETPAVRP